MILGMAAQQALANLFAGLVLLFAHPCRVGSPVRFRVGALGGQLDAPGGRYRPDLRAG